MFRKKIYISGLICMVFVGLVHAQDHSFEYLRAWELYNSELPESFVENRLSYDQLKDLMADSSSWDSIESLHDVVNLTILPNSNNHALLKTTVTSQKEQEAVFRLGSQGGVKIWLNGHNVIDVSEIRLYEHNANFFASNLQKGKNTIVVWLQMWQSDFAFSLSNPLFSIPHIYGQIKDSEGVLLEDVEVTLYCDSKIYSRRVTKSNGFYTAKIPESSSACRLSARTEYLGAELTLPAVLDSNVRTDLVLHPKQFANGTVFLKDGKTPLEGVLLEVEDAETGRLEAVGISKELGQYQLGPLSAGEYRLRYDSPWGKIYLGQSEDNPKGKILQVSAVGKNDLAGARLLVPEFAKGNWTYLTTLEGLPHHIVLDLEIDITGKLLCATRGGGFCQFDGNQFEVLNARHGLPSNIVNDVEHSGPFKYWLATEKGVALYNPFHNEQIKIFGEEDGLPNSFVNALQEDKNGVVWVGTNDGLAQIGDGEIQTMNLDDTLPSRYIMAMHEDTRGRMWIGTRLGTGYFEGPAFHFVEESLGLRVTDIYESKAGDLWFGTSGGLYRQSSGEPPLFSRMHSLQLENVTDVCESADGRIWVGADNKLSVINGQHVTSFPGSDQEEIPITALNCSEPNAIWVGSENGLNRLDFSISTFGIKDGLVKTDFPDEKAGVYDVINNDPESWFIGTGWGGLFELKNNQLTQKYPEEQLFVRKLTNAPSDGIWLSTNEGPIIYNDSSVTTYPVQSWTHTVLKTDDGEIWTGQGWNGNGIQVFDAETKALLRSYSEEDGLPDDHVWFLAQGVQGEIWIGTNKGIGKYQAGRFQNVTKNVGLEESNIFDIEIWGEDEIWFGGSSGVFRLSNGEWSHFTRDGLYQKGKDNWNLIDASLKLPDDIVWTVYKDFNGIAWFGTQSRGLVGYDGKAFTNFDSRSGLSGNQVLGIDSNNEGNLLIGTLDGGLTLYKRESRKSQLYLEEIKSGGEIYEYAEDMPPALTNHLIEIKYKEIDLYTPSDARQFFISISDVDGTLIESHTTKDRLYNWVPDQPGNYFLTLQYLDRNFNYSEPLELQIHVVYPLVQNPIFYVPAILFLIGFALFTARLRSNYVRKKVETAQLKEEMLLQAQDAQRNLEIKNELLLDANRQAEEAKLIAEEAAMAKSLFLSKMSHELRTPMNGVIGMASLLSSTSLDEEQLELVSIIMSSGDSLIQLINDILDFSKIEANKLELEFLETDLRATIEETLDLISATILKKPIQLSYFMPAEIPNLLMTDVTRIKQILFNLLSNATKFTENGKVTLEVSGREIQDARWEYIISVKDTGIGIPEDRLDRLFDSFSQVDESITRRFGGTGLGLSISKQLSEMMGGSLWVKSEMGVGSNFSFSIIAEIADAPEETNFEETSLQNRRALICGFDTFENAMLSHHLESMGVTVEFKPSFDMSSPFEHDFALVNVNEELVDIESEQIQKVIQVKNRGQLGDNSNEISTLVRPIKPASLKEKIEQLFNPAKRDVQESHLPLADCSVLVVDERVLLLKIASRMLTKMGCRVSVAGGLQEAVDVLISKEHQIMLFHSEAPADEIEKKVAAIIRSLEGQRRPLVWLASNTISDEARRRLLEKGIAEIIGFPYERAELMASFEDYLQPDVKPALQAGARANEPAK